MILFEWIKTVCCCAQIAVELFGCLRTFQYNIYIYMYQVLKCPESEIGHGTKQTGRYVAYSHLFLGTSWSTLKELPNCIVSGGSKTAVLRVCVEPYFLCCCSI